ncbi:MAG: acyl-phosphate--glycerol-3-phosphate O-acyltransferase, partial [Moorea sp. SIO3H5]|nr:acyl-phosphate--glycerol-3-phosphate O-acyltransferase [Moorena sp. SIO3H5]
SLLMYLTKAPLAYELFGIAAGIYVIIRHRSNIQRLVTGTEPQIGKSLSPAVSLETGTE